jgi:hypothetical protein
MQLNVKNKTQLVKGIQELDLGTALMSCNKFTRVL